MKVTHTALAALVLALPSSAQTTFAVATFKPASQRVQFESDGRTIITPGQIRMQDVSIDTCIKWAYGILDGQIVGPDLLASPHYDIVAKADTPATEAQMKPMMQALLAERFKLAFHHELRELHTYALVVVKPNPNLKRVADDAPPSRENSAAGMVVRALTMKELTDFLSSPVKSPVLDKTGLPGRYDFTIDFTPYVSEDANGIRPDVISVLNMTFQAEIGLKLVKQKDQVDVLVVDHVEPPTAN